MSGDSTKKGSPPAAPPAPPAAQASPSVPPLEPLKPVSLDARYQAAASEIGTRISARQSAFGFCVAAIGGLVTVLAQYDSARLHLCWLPAFVVYVFAPWITQNSIVMEVLSRYCHACCVHFDPKGSSPPLPNWHSLPAGWYDLSSKTRGGLDLSLICLAALSLLFAGFVSGASILAAAGSGGGEDGGNNPVGQSLLAVACLLLAGYLSISSICRVAKHAMLRRRMREGYYAYTSVGDEWRFLDIQQQPRGCRRD